MFEQTIQMMDSFLEMGIPGYDCIVYKDGKEVFRHMNGYSDFENKVPVKGTERYNIYSCSKPITCTAALQLFEKGLYKLEDPLSDYMPEFKTMYVKTEDGIKEAKKHITIKDLFCMTAGFSYNTASEQLKLARKETDGKCPTRETMKYLAKEPLLFEPSTRWQYSLCHDVLAALIEVLTGERFGAYVKKNIFDPLGMDRTTFLLADEEFDTLAEHYRFYPDTKELRNCGKNIQGFKLGSEYESGGAGCISCVDDYIKFLEAMRIGDVILKKETIDLMAQNHLTSEQHATSNMMPGYTYGLGVRTALPGSGKYDFGWGGAAGAYLAIDRVNRATLFYVQHVMNSPNQTIRYRVKECAWNDLG